VLGIDVSPETLARWVSWFAPPTQPFLVPAGSSLAGLGQEFDPSAAMEPSSQGWMSPVKVLTVADVKRSSRAPRRLTRRTLR
jgi:hypothetical protein